MISGSKKHTGNISKSHLGAGIDQYDAFTRCPKNICNRAAAGDKQGPAGNDSDAVHHAAAGNDKATAGNDRGVIRRTAAGNDEITACCDLVLIRRGPGMDCGGTIQNTGTECIGCKGDARIIRIGDISAILPNSGCRTAAENIQAAAIDIENACNASAGDSQAAVVN